MTTKQFLEGILLPEDGRKTVLLYEMDETEYQEWKYCFYGDPEQFFARADKMEEKETLLLYLYVHFAVELYEEFCRRGISRTIYFATFYDFTIWYCHCVKKKGKCGLVEEKWLSLLLNMKVFRLGRLQFEPGDGVIHVHIPEGKELSPRACDDAFEQAAQFFPEGYKRYDCESWLLSPNLSDILPEESNIIQFRNRFDIRRVSYPFQQAEKRIFGEAREDKNTYPERTTLQKAAKAYVLAGKDIGVGYGIIDIKKLKKCSVRDILKEK